MSLTALGWIALYCAAALLTFLNPIFGALGYLLEYYQRPELHWWGDELPAFRWNLIISVAFGFSFLLRRSSLPAVPPTQNRPLRWMLALYAVMLLVTATVALNFDLSWGWSLQWLKMAVIFPMLVVGVLRTRGAFDTFVVANMLGAFWWGWDAWQDPKREQGRLMNVGSGDSFNDNEAACHLLTVLPMIVVYLFTEKDKRLRGIALLAFPFVVNTLILCNSRGSMVGVGAAFAVALLMIRRGFRMRLVAAGLIVGLIGFSLTDQTFIERQQSTTNYEEDGSAQERLMTWTAGLELIRDRPLGNGGRGFHLLSPIYIPEIVAAHGGDPRAPHNTYVMVAAEWGLAGLICFVAIYVSAFRMLQQVKKVSDPSHDPFFYWRAFGIQLAMVAYLVASVFADRVYGEAGYWLVAMSVGLFRIQKAELASTAAEAPVEQPQATFRPAVAVAS